VRHAVAEDLAEAREHHLADDGLMEPAAGEAAAMKRTGAAAAVRPSTHTVDTEILRQESASNLR